MKVLTIGTFDILHFGHIQIIKKCRDIAGLDGQVIIGLNPDKFVKKFKLALPIMSYKEREFSLKQLPYVSEVLPNCGGQDSKPLIRSVKPDIIVIGSDWARKDYYKQMDFTQDWLDNNDIILCYVPYTKNISTTEIKKRVRDNKK